MANNTPQLLTVEEISKIEDKYPEGISSGAIVKIFKRKGIRFSEATFRKYVQMGLLSRCKRVGQKGKHRGSSGVYPTSIVERINDIKRMTAGDVTMEQLRHSYFSAYNKVDEAVRIVGAAMEDLAGYDNDQAKGMRRTLERRFLSLQQTAGILEKFAEEEFGSRPSVKRG